MSTYTSDFQYICRSCNASFSARDLERAQNGIIRCSQCGYHTALPKKDQLQEVLLQLSHGRNELDNGRFDAAADTYRRAIELAEQNQKHEPEAYFGMALAKYRVQYLYDEVYRRNQPICYRVMEKRFSENEYYQKALRYATGEQQELYRAQAEEIDSIMDCFRDLDRRGIDYDVFLCVKVSEEGPVKRYTDDSHRADQIYRMLEKKGYRPFYSEIQLTRADSVGKTYEPHILYALQKSKSMLLICSDEDYLYSKWVKNEYMRYYRLMQQGKKERGSLAVVYQGSPIDHIPGIQSNGALQGIDFSKFNASDLLTAFVKRYKLGEEGRSAAVKQEPQTPVSPVIQAPQTKSVKYCKDCGTENTAESKFCKSCGKSKFVVTYAEYEKNRKKEFVETEVSKKKSWIKLFNFNKISKVPNYFLYDRNAKRNIPLSKLTFEMVNERMNRYLSCYAISEGRLWTDRIFDNSDLSMEKVFKPAVAYKLLYGLAEKDSEQGWKCFELASVETVEFICLALEMNDDTELAKTLRAFKRALPLNLKNLRDYIVANKAYLKSKLMHYIYDNISNF